MGEHRSCWAEPFKAVLLKYVISIMYMDVSHDFDPFLDSIDSRRAPPSKVCALHVNR